MAMISDSSLAIIKATAPVVKENAEKITTTFYPKLLGRHPDLFRYFNQSNQREVLSGSRCGGPKKSSTQQAKTLADAIVAYAVNIEHLENLSEAVGRMCHKHAALGIQPADYQIVHDNLMEAIGEVLGDAVTAEVAAAWSEAVMALAKICIQTEAQLYEQAAETQWSGVREFVIAELINETDEIKSIRMKPTDGKGTCPYQPGQYISVYEKPAGKEYFAPRHYTVTSQSGDDYYQVSVKKMVVGDFQGIMSHCMHSKKVGDKVQLGPVFGPPPLKMADDKSRVAAFVSVGVGITATISMLPTAINEMSRVAVFHGDASPKTMAFKRYLEDVVPNTKGGLLDIYFSHEIVESPYVSEGRLTGQKIIDALDKEQIDYQNGVDFFLCAGNTATPSINNELLEAGVSKERIHLEFFGPFITPE